MKAEHGMCSLVSAGGPCAQIIKGLMVTKENVSYSIILSINKLWGESRIDPNEHSRNSQSPAEKKVRYESGGIFWK